MRILKNTCIQFYDSTRPSISFKYHKNAGQNDALTHSTKSKKPKLDTNVFLPRRASYNSYQTRSMAKSIHKKLQAPSNFNELPHFLINQIGQELPPSDFITYRRLNKNVRACTKSEIYWRGKYNTQLKKVDLKKFRGPKDFQEYCFNRSKNVDFDQSSPLSNTEWHKNQYLIRNTLQIAMIVG